MNTRRDFFFPETYPTITLYFIQGLAFASTADVLGATECTKAQCHRTTIRLCKQQLQHLLSSVCRLQLMLQLDTQLRTQAKRWHRESLEEIEHREMLA